MWETIYLNYEVRNKKELEEFIINKLKTSLKYLNYKIHPFNPQMPILYLILKGIEPSKLCKINEKDLRKKICDFFPVVDIKIFQKFKSPLKTLDNYILA